jgi:hypothetical protein
LPQLLSFTVQSTTVIRGYKKGKKMLKHLGFILSLVEIEYFQIDKFLFPLQVIGLNMFI